MRSESNSKKNDKVHARNRTLKIVHKPAKEIVIMDYFQFSKDTLNQMFARIMQSGMPVMAEWAEGVIFVHFPLAPDTNDLMDNYIKGRVFWSSVNFALMPKYAASIKISGLEIPLLDVSGHPILREVAKWLRDHSKADVIQWLPNA